MFKISRDKQQENFLVSGNLVLIKTAIAENIFEWINGIKEHAKYLHKKKIAKWQQVEKE